MRIIRHYYNLFICISVIFLMYYLYTYNYIELKNISLNLTLLVLSLLLLFTGFLLSCLCWKEILHKHSINISFKHALCSNGISVFAKYIPGKLWLVLGRASYVSLSGFSLKKASFISLKMQLITISIGISVGITPLFFLEGFIELKMVGVLMILMLTLLFSSKAAHQISLSIASKITKKSFDIPIIQFKDLLSVLLISFFIWGIWSIAFYFFCKSLFGYTAVLSAFAFPLASSIGILAFFAPGGIAVREGLIVYYLVLTGMPIQMAITISILARLWFICGEVFIFIMGLLTKEQFHQMSLRE